MCRGLPSQSCTDRGPGRRTLPGTIGVVPAEAPPTADSSMSSVSSKSPCSLLSPPEGVVSLRFFFIGSVESPLDRLDHDKAQKTLGLESPAPPPPISDKKDTAVAQGPFATRTRVRPPNRGPHDNVMVWVGPPNREGARRPTRHRIRTRGAGVRASTVADAPAGFSTAGETHERRGDSLPPCSSAPDGGTQIPQTRNLLLSQCVPWHCTP